MSKQNIFPVLLDGEVTITADKTWGKTGAGETGFVGYVILNGTNTNDSDLTFDAGDIPAGLESGSLIYVINKSAATQKVILTPSPESDVNADNVDLTAGDVVTVMYHHDHKFIFMSQVQAY